jgi:uncharacterized protein involved in high-affinity Fe2+ transport
MSTSPQDQNTGMPPMKPSQEATKEQLQLAREQGDVYGKAIQAMGKETGQLKTQHVGDYEIGVTVEAAEGLYQLENGKLKWMEPTGENAHVEIVVRDASDGRFIPGLAVQATLSTSDGNEVGTHQMPFLWHPMLYHYGLNWKVPGEGDYRLHVRVDPPQFMRHDHKNGLRYASREEADFTLHIEPGQKRVKQSS